MAYLVSSIQAHSRLGGKYIYAILISSSFYIVFALPLSYFNVSLLIWTIFDKDRGGPNGKLGE